MTSGGRSNGKKVWSPYPILNSLSIVSPCIYARSEALCKIEVSYAQLIYFLSRDKNKTVYFVGHMMSILWGAASFFVINCKIRSFFFEFEHF